MGKVGESVEGPSFIHSGRPVELRDALIRLAPPVPGVYADPHPSLAM